MKVSIIIPCYNTGAYLADCLFSAISQKHEDIEVICVNDGSTDNSLDILREFRDTNYPQLIIIDQVNQGAPSARNNGLKEAKGEYIQFLDSDDMILPFKIQHQVETLNNLEIKPGILVGDFEVINLKGEKQYDKEFRAKANPWMNLLYADLGCTCSNLFKKEDLLKVKGWNEKQKSSQETDLMFRLLREGSSVAFDKSIGTIVRKGRPDAITKLNLAENWKRYTQIRLDIAEHMKSNSIDAPWQEVYQVLFDAIRVLYSFDKKLALEKFNQFIPKGFKPSVSATTGKAYTILYRIFGFKGTEKIKNLKG